MRKWTYLVAALLMGGVSTSLTSCIDNDEPAGINPKIRNYHPIHD
ncbi:hypothetical protein [Phocaeicola coprophilus]|nr:hypothetical protein [Phocaeicola coprophilus]